MLCLRQHLTGRENSVNGSMGSRSLAAQQAGAYMRELRQELAVDVVEQLDKLAAVGLVQPPARYIEECVKGCCRGPRARQRIQ